MTVEHGLHDSSLHAASPAMNETDFLEPCPGSGGQVLFDHGRDIARGKGMKIQFGFDWNKMHAVHARPSSFAFSSPSQKVKGR